MRIRVQVRIRVHVRMRVQARFQVRVRVGVGFRLTFAAPAVRPGMALMRSLGMSAVVLGAMVGRGGGAPGTWSGLGLG